jgi:hypothetical protein
VTDYDGFRVARDDERGLATITLDVLEDELRLDAAREQLADASRRSGPTPACASS